jgi:hypothetical protein
MMKLILPIHLLDVLMDQLEPISMIAQLKLFVLNKIQLDVKMVPVKKAILNVIKILIVLLV